MTIIRNVKWFLCVLVLMACTFQASAQKGKKGISDEHQKEIIKLFEGVDASEYRLVFDNGKETYGRKRIQMKDLKAISRKGGEMSKGIKWTFIAGDRSENEVFYIYTEGETKLASMLGKKKFARLQEIANQYPDPRLR